ncbi:MAG: hypothetical protein ACXWH0_09410 [Acidimicrobiia bacterium]
MTDVVTFGEAVIRLSPPFFSRLEQATSLDVAVGGDTKSDGRPSRLGPPPTRDLGRIAE